MPAGLPSKGPRSPWSVGGRTLLARTCPRCGVLADGESFPVISGVGARRKICHICTNLKKQADRVNRGIGLPTPRPPEALQTAKWLRWTQAEDAYLRESVGAVSYEAMAVHLGRSLQSVYTRRRVLGLAPVRKRHRVELADWKIAPPSNTLFELIE